ncbi:hypothetical protein KM043_001916 [Ampulex compressa]|nr:hypothetical protein KM043_001916 [Ampulex compressa]
MNFGEALEGQGTAESRDWIGRESGYADFAETRPRPALSECPLLRGRKGELDDFLEEPGVRSNADRSGAFVGTDEQGRCAKPIPREAQLPPCGYEGRFFHDSSSPGASDSYRPRTNSRGPNPRRRASSGSCQIGTVDVEDLALYFESEAKAGASCARTFRPTDSCDARNSRCSRSKHDRYARATSKEERYREDPWAFIDAGTDGWLAGRFGEFPHDRRQLFGFCTEERWLECPASDRCPLYEPAYAHDTNLLPPCVYENLGPGYNDNCVYACTEEDCFSENYSSNEKRKERSRDAARCRRSRETDIFSELSAALPVAPEQASHLDKASVMRLAIAFLKVRAVVDAIPGPLTKSESSVEMDQLFPKALNGFMLVLSSDGNMVYLSENVSDYLGVSQMDMMGQSVYEYSHPCDHEELRECLSSKPRENNHKRPCSFFLRLKCTLTSKGRKVNLKSASYKVIHCIGRLTHIRDANANSIELDTDMEKKDEDEAMDASLVLVACPIPHPSNIEVPLGRHTFLSKHNLSMKFTYADEKLAEYLGWDSEELMGQSAFEFYHALDNTTLDKSFKSLFSKGQCETVAYRFLGKRGGYAWVVTQATLIHCSKQRKPLSVVCVNYVLSGVEREDEVYSVRQLAARNAAEAVRTSGSARSGLAVGEEPERKPPAEARPECAEEAALEAARSLEASWERGGCDRGKPLAVTASTFRAALPGKRRDGPRAQGGSRKDNTFPRPVPLGEKIVLDARAAKPAPEECLKENEEPARKRQDRGLSAGRVEHPPFVFQGKPAVEYDSECGVRRERPQAVTRHLFAPLASEQQQAEQPPSCRPPPQTATASIFAPRTEDMNKGFLTFSEDQPGLTMLKDEPEDLTHLAPTPGDVCVPLEDTPFLSDMLDEFILGNDNYCPLLSPGGALASELRGADLADPLKDPDLGDIAKGKSLGESLADSDPFMYGDSPSSPCGIDPNPVSPSLAKYRQSPERSIDSLGSPTGGSAGEGLSEDEMLMLGIGDSIADDELALRAPYIPMSDQDEALELLISDDMVMWGPSQMTDKGTSKWLVEDRDQRGSDSSLAQLLRTDQAVSRRYNDHGGGLVNPAQVLGQMPRKSATLDASRWSTKSPGRAERSGNKRIHAAGIEIEAEKKRLKCEEPSSRNVFPQPEKQPSMELEQVASRRSAGIGSGSQLLRRLVSQQAIGRGGAASKEVRRGSEGRQEERGGGRSRGTSEDLDLDLEIDEAEVDAGGGRGGRGEREEGEEACRTTSRRNPPCSSVLMNLLVSGCDEALMDSRSVPTMFPKSSTSALAVNLDNQMVPRCIDASVAPNRPSPDIGKHLAAGTFLGGGTTLISPSSSIMALDQFDYNGGAPTSGLLQVHSDLLGTLLDRNLV